MIDLTGYKLTFDDEFNQRSISQTGATTWSDIRSDWRFDAQSDIGFGHSSFVDPGSGYDPFNVAGGALTITAVPDRTASGFPGSWESGLITTQGKFSQTYGYFEMRADLSESTGAWDAFWLLPDKAINPTPQAWQELDVVEHYGADPASTYRWIHTTDPSTNVNAERQVTTSNPEQASGYHTYGMDWQADRISFYFDGQYMGSQATPSDMHSPMYLLANLATQDNAQGSSMSMSIDYIRAYSADPNATAVTAGAISAPDGQDPGFYGATIAGDSGHTPAAAATPATPPVAAADPITTEPAPAAAAPISTDPVAPSSSVDAAPALPDTPTEAPAPEIIAARPAAAPASSAPVTADVVEAGAPPVDAIPATDPRVVSQVDEVRQPAASPAEVFIPQSPVAPSRSQVETSADATPAIETTAPSHGCGRSQAERPAHHGNDFEAGVHHWHHMTQHVHHHEWSF